MQNKGALVLFLLALSSVALVAVVAVGVYFLGNITETVLPVSGIEGEAFFKEDGRDPEELAGLMIEIYPMEYYKLWKKAEDERLEEISALKGKVALQKNKVMEATAIHAAERGEADSARRTHQQLDQEKNRLQKELQTWKAAFDALKKHEDHLNRIKSNHYPFLDPILKKQVALNWHDKQMMDAHFFQSRTHGNGIVAPKMTRFNELEAIVPDAERASSKETSESQQAAIRKSQEQDGLAKLQRSLNAKLYSGPTLPPRTERLLQKPVSIDGTFSIEIEEGTYWLSARHETSWGALINWNEVVTVPARKAVQVQLNQDNADFHLIANSN